MRGRLHEVRDVDIPNARPDHERNIHRVLRNLIANQVERQRLGRALASHRHRNMRPAWPLQQGSHRSRVHILRRLAIHRENHIARMDTRPIRRCSLHRRHNHNLIVLRLNPHAYAVVLAALVLAHLRVALRIVEIRMWIEHMQHARNRPIVDRLVHLVGVQFVGVVLLHQRVDVRELLHRVAQRRLIRGRLRSNPATDKRARKPTGCKKDRC